MYLSARTFDHMPYIQIVRDSLENVRVYAFSEYLPDWNAYHIMDMQKVSFSLLVVNVPIYGVHNLFLKWSIFCTARNKISLSRVLYSECDDSILKLKKIRCRTPCTKTVFRQYASKDVISIHRAFERYARISCMFSRR